MPGDIRIGQCLDIEKDTWTVRPQVFFLSGFYSDPWDKREFAGGMVIVEASSQNGMGLQLDFSYSWHLLRYSADDFRQSAPGGALFYLKNNAFFWLHYSVLLGNDEDQGVGHVISMYGNYHTPLFMDLGASFDVGLYDGFQTLQVAPEFVYKPKTWFEVKLSFMAQSRFGLILREESAKDKKYRMSNGLSFTFNLPNAVLTLGGFYGRRWFTVENRGLLIWNSDEDIVSGVRLDATLLPEMVISPTAAFRFDYADHQFGLPHEFCIFGFIVGLTATL